MTNRITEKNLQAVVDRINRTMATPMDSYKVVDGKHVAQVGNYHLSFAYGGVNLCQMVNEGGGCRNVFSCGHVTKRDLYDRMQAYLSGIADMEGRI